MKRSVVLSQVIMAVLIGLVIGIMGAVGVISIISAPVASAACYNPQDDFCPPYWTPKHQAKKVDEETLDKLIAESRLVELKTCDDKCADKYDQDRGGVLTKMAGLKELPKTKVIKAFIAYWDSRAKAADDLGKAWDQGEVAAVWANDFADVIRAPHPYYIFPGTDNKRYCLMPDYGGKCPGKW
ncbi:MAG: hypothetical protein HZB51_34095 [Chloroflexi bacterium]|nr:hypothetical protein [Chloroflexota bacterium]